MANLLNHERRQREKKKRCLGYDAKREVKKTKNDDWHSKYISVYFIVYISFLFQLMMFCELGIYTKTIIELHICELFTCLSTYHLFLGILSNREEKKKFSPIDPMEERLLTIHCLTSSLPPRVFITTASPWAQILAHTLFSYIPYLYFTHKYDDPSYCCFTQNQLFLSCGEHPTCVFDRNPCSRRGRSDSPAGLWWPTKYSLHHLFCYFRWYETYFAILLIYFLSWHDQWLPNIYCF